MTWRVIAKYKDQKKSKTFTDEELAKQYMDKLKEKFKGKDVGIYLVSSLKAYTPEECGIDIRRTIKRLTLWCPYCRDKREFKTSGYDGYNRCVICGISDSDYYVKRINFMADGGDNTDNTDNTDKKQRVKRK